jgi:hypothetical protein
MLIHFISKHHTVQVSRQTTIDNIWRIRTDTVRQILLGEVN